MIPRFWSIEPTNVCDLRCPQCPSGSGWLSRRRGFLRPEDYALMLDRIAPHALYLNLYLQGEPTLHPQLPTLIRMAKERNLYVATSTNGQRVNAQMARQLVRSGLDKIIVSVDGADQASYATYRVGGQLEKACQTIQYLAEYKRLIGTRAPRIEMQTLAFQHNQDQLPRMKQLAKSLGADTFRVKTAQFYTLAPDDTLRPPKSERLSRYAETADGSLRLKRTLPNRCFHLLTSAAVTWEGDVLPCVFDKDARHAFGNVLREDLTDIFSSRAAREFRQRIFSKRTSIDICGNCCY